MTTCGDSGGRRKDGAPCGSRLNLGQTGLCLQHDPVRATERQELNKAGGRAARAKDMAARAQDRAARAELDALDMPEGRPQTLEDAVSWSAWAIRAVAVGSIDARMGHEVGYLVNAFMSATEKRDLLREIKTLQAERDALRRQMGPKIA